MTSRRTKPVRKVAPVDQRRRELLTFLRSDRPAWREHDHPELAAGTAAWVRNLRRESERRRRL
jgi:hypothetical protein